MAQQQQPKNTYFECPRVVHESIVCASCKRKSIAGIRYRCGHCPNLDLCEPCYRSVKHDETHLFVIIKDPIGYLPSQPLISIIPKLLKTNNTLASTPNNPLASSFNADQFTMQLNKEEQANNRRFAPLNDSFHSFNDSNDNRPTSIFSQLSQTAAEQQRTQLLPMSTNSSFGSFFESKKTNPPNTGNSNGFSGFGPIGNNNTQFSFDNNNTTIVRQETNQTSYFGSTASTPFTSPSNTFVFGTSIPYMSSSFGGGGDNNTHYSSSLPNTEEGMETDLRGKPFTF